jgi:hypothetical protein
LSLGLLLLEGFVVEDFFDLEDAIGELNDVLGAAWTHLGQHYIRAELENG